MKIKLLVELAPLTIFIVAVLLKLLNVPGLSLVIFFDGLLLMTIYMFLSFWLFDDPTILTVYKILIGLVYMFTIFVSIFFLFNGYGFLLLVGVGYTFLLFHFLICLFKIKTRFYQQHFFRSLLLLIVLTLIYVHHYH